MTHSNYFWYLPVVNEKINTAGPISEYNIEKNCPVHSGCHKNQVHPTGPSIRTGHNPIFPNPAPYKVVVASYTLQLYKLVKIVFIQRTPININRNDFYNQNLSNIW